MTECSQEASSRAPFLLTVGPILLLRRLSAANIRAWQDACSNRDGDVTVRNYLFHWKTHIAARQSLLWIGAMLLLPANAFCSRVPKTVPDGLKVDHLGESLREFRSVHRKAYCHRAYGEWTEEDPRGTWFLWIHCSLDAGVTFGGYKLLSESDHRYPFGAYAIFHRKRLVAITYTLFTESIESLVLLIGHAYSQPLTTKKDYDGMLTGAFWTDNRFSVVVRLIPIQALNSDEGLLRVTSNILVFATSVSFAARDEPEYWD